MATPLTLSANRGQVPLNGTQTSPGRNSPSRAQNRTPGYPKPATPTAVPPRRGLRALLAPTSPQADGSVSPPAAEDIQKVLFAAPAATPAPAAMETEDALQSTRKKADEAVTYLRVACPNFSAAARKEPREAWRLLLLAQSKADSQRLRPLDILPVSATAAEIFIPESLLPVYREAFQQFVIDRYSPPSDRSGGLSPAGNCVSEQLFQVVSPADPSRFLIETPGGLPVLPLERRSESDRTPTVQVQEPTMDSEAGSSGVHLLSGQTED